MAYYRITIELKDKTITGVREYERGLDMAFTTFKFAADEFYGSKMLHFDCVQLADRSEEVQTLIKQKGKTGKTRYEPEPGMNLGIDPIDESKLKLANRPGPNKNNGKETPKPGLTLAERAKLEQLKRENNNGKR